MSFHLHVVTRHPIIATELSRLISNDSQLETILCKGSIDHFTAPTPHRQPHVFILDAYSLLDRLIETSRILRMQYPRSKFLALGSIETDSCESMLRLLFAGINGAVKIRGQWQIEFLEAVREILTGNLWFPPNVIAEYVKHTNSLIEVQTCPDRSLTARENQILQLMIRRRSNKEIAGTLRITERTVKFHVSNVLAKIRIGRRRELFTLMPLPTPFTS